MKLSEIAEECNHCIREQGARFGVRPTWGEIDAMFIFLFSGISPETRETLKALLRFEEYDTNGHSIRPTSALQMLVSRASYALECQ